MKDFQTFFLSGKNQEKCHVSSEFLDTVNVAHKPYCVTVLFKYLNAF